MLVDGLGCWLSSREGGVRSFAGAALFLDRDDVVLVDTGYMHKPEDVTLMEGASKVIRWANSRAIPVILVTNQSGIARGLFDWSDFDCVSQRLLALLEQEDAWLDAILACAWHEDGLPPLQYPDHPWRKPGPGMFRKAQDAFGCDLATSWMVGDRASDIEAARRAGLAGAIWLKQAEPVPLCETLVAQPAFAVREASSMLQVRQVLPTLYCQQEEAFHAR